MLVKLLAIVLLPVVGLAAPDGLPMATSAEAPQIDREGTIQPPAFPSLLTASNRLFAPIISSALPPELPSDRNDAKAFVNYYRSLAGVPPVNFDPTLDNNCLLHARYMAEENYIGHTENPASRWYSSGGLACAQNGNAWLGGESLRPIWDPAAAVEGWMGSVGHRLWLIYPTTPTFGFGFYSAANNRAGSALDVLSRMRSDLDTNYRGWPLRYPADGQKGVPAEKYSITLNWRYFGPSPVIGSSSLEKADGSPVAHTVTTALPVGHRGIEVLPNEPLSPNTTYQVTLTGAYDGRTFSETWSFQTNN